MFLDSAIDPAFTSFGRPENKVLLFLYALFTILTTFL